MTDDRYYITFYGLKTNDWETDWGSFSDTNYHLVKEYLSDGCSTSSYSIWNGNGIKFIYPNYIKKKYYLEGVVEGHITFFAYAADSWVSDYQVTIFKANSSAVDTDLATTGVISVPTMLDYDVTWHTGEDRVFPFWIDVSSGKLIEENDRIGLRIQWDVSDGDGSRASVFLMHDNDSEFEDVKITLPFNFGE